MLLETLVQAYAVTALFISHAALFNGESQLLLLLGFVLPDFLVNTLPSNMGDGDYSLVKGMFIIGDVFFATLLVLKAAYMAA